MNQYFNRDNIYNITIHTDLQTVFNLMKTNSVIRNYIYNDSRFINVMLLFINMIYFRDTSKLKIYLNISKYHYYKLRFLHEALFYRIDLYLDTILSQFHNKYSVYRRNIHNSILFRGIDHGIHYLSAGELKYIIRKNIKVKYPHDIFIFKYDIRSIQWYCDDEKIQICCHKIDKYKLTYMVENYNNYYHNEYELCYKCIWNGYCDLLNIYGHDFNYKDIYEFCKHPVDNLIVLYLTHLNKKINKKIILLNYDFP